MTKYIEVRVRELTSHGTWPWRWVVEGLTADRIVKRWPWVDVKETGTWVGLSHGVFGRSPVTQENADALAEHYRSSKDAS